MRKLCARSNLSSSSASSVQLPQTSSFPSQLPSFSPPQKTEAQLKFDKNLRGMKKIAFVANLTIICSWFLGLCALTWASAVLLGGYIDELTMWDYYDVSLLLFVEGLRFGLAAMVQFLGYRLWDLCRWALRSIAFFLPVGMGGFAVLSMLPPETRHSIHCRFAGRNSSFLLHRHDMLPVITAISHAHDTAPPPSYQSLHPSLMIFYVLILSNAFVLLLGSSITGLMRLRYVRSSVKSLSKYHDKMMDSSTSWLHPTADLAFAYQIQGSQYRKRKDARYVCKNYAHLIYYLYMHDKGMEAVEAALATEDGYVREGAANIIGFWAVLETLKEVKGSKVPLCFQKGILSKLADIAAESYGSLGTAAASSFVLLLKLVDPKLTRMVACVPAERAKQDLIGILVGRTAEIMLYRPDSLQKESHIHMYALRQYLQKGSSNTEIAAHIASKVKEAFPELVQQAGTVGKRIIKSLDDKLSEALAQQSEYDKYYEKYVEDIERWLRECVTGSLPPPTWATPIKAGFVLLFNVGFPLVWLGVGFIVNALW